MEEIKNKTICSRCGDEYDTYRDGECQTCEAEEEMEILEKYKTDDWVDDFNEFCIKIGQDCEDIGGYENRKMIEFISNKIIEVKKEETQRIINIIKKERSETFFGRNESWDTGFNTALDIILSKI